MRASVLSARELSSCGAWAQLLCGLWDLSGPGVIPMSSVLASGFSTASAPGKPVPVSWCYSLPQLRPTLCDPTGCRAPGLSVLHCLLKFAQVHVHCISDTIQPSHLLTPSSPSALSLSQCQGLSGVFFNTTVRRHQFFGVLPHNHM